MNKGIGFATGDYINFLGADDALIDCSIVENVYQILNNNSYPDLLSCNVFFVDEKNKIQKLQSNEIAKKELYAGMPHQGIFAHKNLLNYSLFNINYSIVSDYEFMIKCKLYMNIKIVYSDVIVAFNGLGGVSSKFESIRKQEHLEVMNKYLASDEEKKEYIKSNNKTFFTLLKSVLDIFKIAKILKLMFGWEKHKCDWAVCRWCGRK